jgi:putative sterol carrier protein
MTALSVEPRNATRTFGLGEYMCRELPERFRSTMLNAVPSAADQPELTITYEILGVGGGVFGMRVAAGQFQVIPDGIADADMRTVLSVDDWWRTHVAEWEEPLFKFVRQGKVTGVKNLSGTFMLRLKRPDGSTFQANTIFRGQAEPTVTLRMTVEDYVALTTGGLNGQLALTLGKLRFDGSLPFLLKLALNT